MNFDNATLISFHRGVILFTLVNGRVPYDDDRIPVRDDMMRKQKLVFTRKVSDGKRTM